MARSLAPNAAIKPPNAKMVVEAKNAAPFCRLPMMLASTMRCSRRSICCIHRSR